MTCKKYKSPIPCVLSHVIKFQFQKEQVSAYKMEAANFLRPLVSNNDIQEDANHIHHFPHHDSARRPKTCQKHSSICHQLCSQLVDAVIQFIHLQVFLCHKNGLFHHIPCPPFYYFIINSLKEKIKTKNKTKKGQNQKSGTHSQLGEFSSWHQRLIDCFCMQVSKFLKTSLHLYNFFHFLTLEWPLFWDK